MQLIDTHAHPQTQAFDADRAAVLARARAAGVTTIITVGTDPASNRAALALAGAEPGLWATAGIHPHDAKDATPAAWEELERLAADPLVVALGEMGLDFYRNLSPPEVQRAAFQRQLDLAARLDLPVVVHSRDAEDATWEILAPWARARRRAGASAPLGVLHCYAYGPERALEYVALGLLISIPGTVTYPNNHRLQAVARALPADALVLETDCPYLTPQSRRGRRNEPAYLVETAQTVAELRGVPAEELAAVTTANARRLFRLAQREQMTARPQPHAESRP